ncbi:Acylamino-acid-releasing enzyme [Lamellibrachia satsuma]|nr:Acylamino-acid-releasing enzyme [Lamellibrachia satsuma]
MVLQIEEAIDIYRNIVKFPSIDHACVINGNSPGHLVVQSQWSQRDLERSEKVKFVRSHIVQADDVVVATPPHEINEQWGRDSHSGKQRAVIRKIKNKKGEEKQFIEIWSASEKVSSIDVKTLERQHGSIYEDDGIFGCLEWSPSEKHLLYVAEKKEPDTKSYFDKKAAGDADEGKEVTRGDEFVYREGWGELLTTKVHPVLCILDVEKGVVSILNNMPDEVSPGQAVWCADSLGIVCVCWEHAPYRLGLIACPIRRSTLYYVDLKTLQCSTLGETDKAVRTPVFSPDHSKLVWLQNDVGGAHQQCSRLLMCDWSNKGITPVLGVVRRVSDPGFPGIFTRGLHRRCWANDNRRILIQTQWRSKEELVLIDSETGNVTRLTNSADIGSWQLLDVCNDLVIVACSSPNQPQHLVTGQLPGNGQEARMKWTNLDPMSITMTDVRWSVFSVCPPATQKESDGLDYECYLLETEVRLDPNMKPPLAVYIHGGPHSSLSTEFIPYLAGLCRCGYSVLVANYRGSTGFGQDGIESLLGNVGTQDVKDVQNAVEKVLEMDMVDKDRMVVIGGSHGGFLTAHLIGQFPNFYKAAVCRNPVIDLCSMFGTTDIPDWVMSENGLTFTHAQTANPEIYKELWKRSPIRYVDQMQTPVMIMLGTDDRRVPNQQGHLLRKALQARGIPVK